ncbi:MAG: uroporphyrinogen-III C-methyltransferase [Neisseria sp.]|nr:uroporphyrinogen-III C-methyltransferase [Neisseria sp.]
MPSADAAHSGNGADQARPQQAAQAAQAAPAVAAPLVIRQSGGKTLAAGALVLSVLALGASGFLFVQGQNVLKNQELSFNQKIDKAALGESRNAGLLEESIRRQEGLQTAFDRLETAQKQNAEHIAQANRAYQELLKGRANWLVDEVEATLNLAAQQLLLSGNVVVAANVLENIENRLNRFEQADLLPIKQAVSSDLTALKGRPYLDIAGTSLRIDRLESAVAGLPLTLDSALQNQSVQTAGQNHTGLSWWESTWNTVWSALQGLVEVRTLNNGDAMLLSPEQIYFVRENLRLRLLDARAALMQHNGEVYYSDLDGAETTVKQYFDTNSPATQFWLKELADLKALDVRMVSGDALRNSLLAVRNYQDTVRQNSHVQTEAAASDPAASAPSEPSEQTAPEDKASEPSAAKGGQA